MLRMNGWLRDWIDEWMDDWMNGWLNEWMDDWMNEWMTEWMNDRMSDWITGWMTEWMNQSLPGWLNQCATDWMNEWVLNWLTDSLTEELNQWMTERMSESRSEWMNAFNDRSSLRPFSGFKYSLRVWGIRGDPWRVSESGSIWIIGRIEELDSWDIASILIRAILCRENTDSTMWQYLCRKEGQNMNPRFFEKKENKLQAMTIFKRRGFCDVKFLMELKSIHEESACTQISSHRIE
jgi:hypothetical protein